MKFSKVLLVCLSTLLLCSCGGGSDKGKEATSSKPVQSSSEAPKAVEFDLPQKFMTDIGGNFYGNYVFTFESATKTLKADWFDEYANYPDTKNASKSFSKQLTYQVKEGEGYKNDSYASTKHDNHDFTFYVTSDDKPRLNGYPLVEFSESAFSKATQAQGTYISEEKVKVAEIGSSGASKYIKLEFGSKQSLYTSDDKNSWQAMYSLESFSWIKASGLADAKTGVSLHTFDLEAHTLKLIKSETTDYPLTVGTVVLTKAS